jgi:hypothetical protein
VDGRGGFAIVETEDVTSIARDVAIFNVFFDFNVYPVVDVQESAPDRWRSGRVPSQRWIAGWQAAPRDYQQPSGTTYSNRECRALAAKYVRRRGAVGACCGSTLQP